MRSRFEEDEKSLPEKKGPSTPAAKPKSQAKANSKARGSGRGGRGKDEGTVTINSEDDGDNGSALDDVPSPKDLFDAASPDFDAAEDPVVHKKPTCKVAGKKNSVIMPQR